VGVLLLRASAAALRLDRARSWLAAQPAGTEVLVVGASAEAARELLRGTAASVGAAFGWHRATLAALARELATPALVDAGLAPIAALGSEAVVARALHELGAAGRLGRYAAVADGPGLARAVRLALDELRFAAVDAGALARVAPDLAAVRGVYERELADARLADRADVFARAVEAAIDTETRHPWLGLPTLLLDVPVERELEAALVAALAGRAPSLVATLPAGDEATRARLRALDGVDEVDLDRAEPAGALGRLQRHLFETAPSGAAPGDDVALLSAPGESRECVEIARRVRGLAAEGVPFDRMAVLLRAAEVYRPHLEEAFARAGVPVHFARGARRPDPAGRAFLALLGCAAEGLSARAFAEYLSLGEVPPASDAGAPPAPLAGPERWVAPDAELVPEVVAEALAAAAGPDAPTGPVSAGPDAPTGRASADREAAPVVEGALRAPRRWEALLVDAAVIGGRERWARRLAGLQRERELELGEVDDPDSPLAERLRRDLRDLSSLRDYALPLIDELAALPGRASWGEWLERLSALATRALRRPQRVLAVLSELVPMAGVGPVDLAEVQRVLAPRLVEVAEPPPPRRYGRVYVAPAEAARGLAFDVVFVPGLAERLFPAKIQEDPILLDADREALGAGLETNDGRRRRERRALRLAVGAAGRRLVLSFPRLDLDQGRPRVPSFYALEALRAAEGRLPGFEELRARAETATQIRVGWPAPRDASEAIDEAEHDLALLESILELGEEAGAGTARYLLGANPHLGRALRFRARRWLRRWTGADGLVRPSEDARERIAEAALDALAGHALGARSYSPTALQHYAACPYRFYLHAIQRLAPREVPEAIEEIDPLSRGSLVHDVQYALLGRLRDAELLPVTPANLSRAGPILETVLDEVAARYRDDLAPAIDRVWDDAVASVRADLREWLRRAGEDASGFVPWRFELAFGLPGRRGRDAHSRPEPVELDSGLRLRGSIDLVERRRDSAEAETLRVTDHKTGRNRVEAGAVVAGGEALQPVLYALAAEKLVPEARVESGRLYYCTASGGFEQVVVPLDDVARQSAKIVSDAVAAGLAEPFLPAAPAEDRTCAWCDYRPICGPYEALRSARKPPERLAALRQVRELP
jgi:CRISPR/Cas system-associated exonuclease Cas4 (RecB family)